MSKDGQYLEHWLLLEHGDIIKLSDKFSTETKWEKDRINNAFHEVFYQSKKVTW